ncbi:hypothetical protein EVAR_58026_1 [Eumeta japonica]|uniref:Uncharacterized protein n=1 Tax=Eumeta variegata TaxID=151549 RepID=A0A4C1ZFP3_EUMVA|nr:hypothetical protein EVAR_58026_1 [Eumeta japonica]
MVPRAPPGRGGRGAGAARRLFVLATKLRLAMNDWFIRPTGCWAPCAPFLPSSFSLLKQNGAKHEYTNTSSPVPVHVPSAAAAADSFEANQTSRRNVTIKFVGAMKNYRGYKNIAGARPSDSAYEFISEHNPARVLGHLLTPLETNAFYNVQCDDLKYYRGHGRNARHDLSERFISQFAHRKPCTAPFSKKIRDWPLGKSMGAQAVTVYNAVLSPPPHEMLDQALDSAPLTITLEPANNKEAIKVHDESCFQATPLTRSGYALLLKVKDVP